jgi:hypothetical protein
MGGILGYRFRQLQRGRSAAKARTIAIRQGSSSRLFGKAARAAKQRDDVVNHCFPHRKSQELKRLPMTLVSLQWQWPKSSDRVAHGLARSLLAAVRRRARCTCILSFFVRSESHTITFSSSALLHLCFLCCFVSTRWILSASKIEVIGGTSWPRFTRATSLQHLTRGVHLWKLSTFDCSPTSNSFFHRHLNCVSAIQDLRALRSCT